MKSLGLALFAAGALAAADGPGLGNVDYSTTHDQWETIAEFTAATGAPRGHAAAAMINGYLVVPFTGGGGGGDGTGGFSLYDVSDPTAPVLVFTTEGNPAYDDTGDADYVGDAREAHTIALSGDLMVLPTNGGSSGTGITIWDLSTPTTDPDGSDPASATGPTKIADLPLPGLSGGGYDNTPWWVSWQGRWIYVAGISDGLYIVDAADPSDPVLADRGGDPNPIPTSQLGGFPIHQAQVMGNLMVLARNEFTASKQFGIAIADISDPLDPVLKWSTTDAGVGYSFMLSENRILGAHDPVRFWDISGWEASDYAGPGAAEQVENWGSNGGYGTVQDGIFHVGVSNRVGKIRISDLTMLGFTTPTMVDGTNFTDADWDFDIVLGNLAFCGSDEDYGSALVIHDQAPDTTAPSVTMIVPGDGWTDQATTSRIGLGFSDQLAPDTVRTDTIIVRPVGTSEGIAGTWSTQTGIANFSPDAELQAGVEYEIVVLAGGVEDVAGNAVASEQTFTFTVAGSAPSAPEVSLAANAAAEIGAAVEFAAHTDGGSGAIEYRWDFGDGTVLGYDAGDGPSHTYGAAGHYTVTVTARDELDRTDSASFVQTVHHPLIANAPTHSGTIAYDAVADLVYVVNADNDTISAVSTTGTPSKGWELAVGDHPRTLALDGDGELWVVNQDDATISIVDPTVPEVVSTLNLPHGSEPYGICFSPDASVAYVTLQVSADDPHRPGGRLLAIDPSAQTSLSVFDSAALPLKPRGIAVSGDGTRVFVTRFVSPADQGEVFEVDPTDMSVTTIPLAIDPGRGGAEPDDEADARGVPNYLQTVAISPDGLRAWVPGKKDNVERGTADSKDGRELTFETTVRTIIAPLDLTAGTVAEMDLVDERFDFNDADLANAVAFTGLGDYLFVSLQGTREVAVLDAYDQQLVHSIGGTGLAPQGVVLSDEGRLFVHNFMSRSVSVHDVSGIVDSSNITSADVGSVSTVASESLTSDVLAGKQIFYDAHDDRMSRDDYLSCASCHLDGGADQRVWDFTQRGEGLRNTVDLRGRKGAAVGRVHWTGNFDEIQDFENDIRNEFGGDGFLPDADWNDPAIRDPLGTAKAGRSTELDQIAAYVASLDTVGESPFRTANGGPTPAAVRGRWIFRRAACHTCHSGQEFSDSATGIRHDVGTIVVDSGQRSGAPLDGFDTPGLRGLWRTAPYLHDGSAATLHEVLANPDHGDAELLSDLERDDLVAFLLQLDDRAPGAPDVRVIELVISPRTTGDTTAFELMTEPAGSGDPQRSVIEGGVRFDGLDSGADHRVRMLSPAEGEG